MIKISVDRNEALERAITAIRDIVSVPGWPQLRAMASCLSWMDVREAVCPTFEKLEGSACDEWLGMLESAVVAVLHGNPQIFEEPEQAAAVVVEWLASHPNVVMHEA